MVNQVSQNHYINEAKRSFENMAKLKYLEVTVTNKKCIHKEIKSRLNSGNALYHAVQNLLSSHLLCSKSKD
jgi:hypothetical protein